MRFSAAAPDRWSRPDTWHHQGPFASRWLPSTRSYLRRRSRQRFESSWFSRRDGCANLAGDGYQHFQIRARFRCALDNMQRARDRRLQFVEQRAFLHMAVQHEFEILPLALRVNDLAI